ncbi:DNA replication and repair protein RecF [Chlamydiia bacterium]|nr:DNA replication and repair protein RecF [Chlamydiia bacterium]
MHFSRITFSNWRNFRQLEMSLNPGINYIVGPNGVGKTNFLEAILTCAYGSPFTTSKTSNLIHFEANQSTIDAILKKKSIENHLKLVVTSKERVLWYNGDKCKAWKGLVPVVTIVPQDIGIIKHEPANRRRYLDNLLIQSDPLYLHFLRRYTKICNHRNALLKQGKLSQIDMWDRQFAESAEYLTLRRCELIKQINESYQNRVNMFSKDIKVKIKYLPTVSMKVVEKLKYVYYKALKENIHTQQKLKTTLVGPHREDIEIKMNDKSARTYASQGQSMILLIGLKFAAYDHLNTQQKPLLLIDEFAMTLDPQSKKIFLNALADKGQVFLTTTSTIPYDQHIDASITKHNFG